MPKMHMLSQKPKRLNLKLIKLQRKKLLIMQLLQVLILQIKQLMMHQSSMLTLQPLLKWKLKLKIWKRNSNFSSCPDRKLFLDRKLGFTVLSHLDARTPDGRFSSSFGISNLLFCDMTFCSVMYAVQIDISAQYIVIHSLSFHKINKII